MQKWINERGIGRDLPFLIDSKNILDTIDVLVEKNQLATAEKIIEKKLKQLSGLALIDPAAAILEMQYMDSLFAVKQILLLTYCYEQAYIMGCSWLWKTMYRISYVLRFCCRYKSNL